MEALDRRTKTDWAHQVRHVLEAHYPGAEKVVLVIDDLNTHNTSLLSGAFDPITAFNLSQRLVIHHTPPQKKHGSWLNIAEIELSARSG